MSPRMMIAVAAYKLRWWRWFYLDNAVRWGDPSLGRSRAERNNNIRLLSARWREREPKDPRK